jgi:hypothetical protein
MTRFSWQLRHSKGFPDQEHPWHDQFFFRGNSAIPRVFLIKNTLGMTNFSSLTENLVMRRVV